MSTKMYDYIIVGGGQTGCVLASRLSTLLPSASILLLEAGPLANSSPFTVAAIDAFKLHHSSVDWSYSSTPQKHLKDRIIYTASGKAVGGGTTVNYGWWMEGDIPVDYRCIEDAVGDPEWGWELGWKAAFERVRKEIQTTSVTDSGRQFPLRTPIAKALEEVGVHYRLDGASRLGYEEVRETSLKGKRQAAGRDVYQLNEKNIEVRTESLVKRVLLQTNTKGKEVAVGVELATGEQILVAPETGEVLVCSGAYQSPKILMLSGIGPRSELEKYNIEVRVEAAEVGRNLIGHMGVPQWWNVQNPEQGVAIGTDKWTDPVWFGGIPEDWAAYCSTPRATLATALAEDGLDDQAITQHDLLRYGPRCDSELLVCYAPTMNEETGADVPYDGSIISTVVLGLMPTSRGTVALQSADPAQYPLLDLNFYATEADRASIRHGVRQATRLMVGTESGRAVIKSEVTPPGMLPLHPDNSSDADIDARVRHVGATLNHATGSASLGKVVDAQCRVYKVGGLRVVDASVLPVPMSCHTMGVCYALGEKMASVIANARVE